MLVGHACSAWVAFFFLLNPHLNSSWMRKLIARSTKFYTILYIKTGKKKTLQTSLKLHSTQTQIKLLFLYNFANISSENYTIYN